MKAWLCTMVALPCMRNFWLSLHEIHKGWNKCPHSSRCQSCDDPSGNIPRQGLGAKQVSWAVYAIHRIPYQAMQMGQRQARLRLTVLCCSLAAHPGLWRKVVYQALHAETLVSRVQTSSLCNFVTSTADKYPGRWREKELEKWEGGLWTSWSSSVGTHFKCDSQHDQSPLPGLHVPRL